MKTILFVILSYFFVSQALAEDAALPLGPEPRDLNYEYFSVEKVELEKVPLWLKWKNVESATSYEIQISRYSDFKKFEVFKRPQNSIPIAVFPEKKYFWRVRALNQDNYITEYSVGSFFTAYYVGEEHVLTGIPSSDEQTTEGSDVDRETAAVDAGEIKAEVEVKEPWIKKTDWNIQVGGLTGYYVYDQKFSGQVESNFKAFHKMGAQVKAGVEFNDKWGVVGQFELAKGNFSSTGLINKTDYTYTKFGADFTYKISDDGSKFMGMAQELVLYTGIESLTNPFVRINQTGNILLEESKILNLDIGLAWDLKANEKWSYHGLAKYYIPFSASTTVGTLKLTPSFTFDFEAGPVYHLSDRMTLAAYWQVVFRNYQGVYNNTFSDYSGYQRNIMSNIDLRFGFDF